MPVQNATVWPVFAPFSGHFVPFLDAVNPVRDRDSAPGRNASRKISQSDKGRTSDKVAAAIGIGSGRTLEKADKVWQAAKHGDELAKKLVTDLDAGKTTIHHPSGRKA